MIIDLDAHQGNGYANDKLAGPVNIQLSSLPFIRFIGSNIELF
jgi:hypothetical protein